MFARPTMGALGVWAALGPVGGCASDAGDQVLCVRAAIVGGTQRADYLALPESQEQAVVQLLSRAGPLEISCSGVVVADGVVLTAAHCLNWEPEEVWLLFQSHDGSSHGVPVDLGRVTIHPNLDLGLLNWDDHEHLAEPIPVLFDVPTAPGTLVQVAGFGIDETGAAGARRFAVLEVKDSQQASFRVDSAGRAGACGGDSGGPALVRDEMGRVVAVGVLSTGSVGCAENDEYVALAGLGSWFTGDVAAGASQTGGTDCALLPETGRCFGASVAYCVDGEPRVSACDAGQVCGFSVEKAGFRCVAAADDPCQGLGDRGRCDGDNRLWCDEGTVRASRCDSCGAACEFSVRDGRAVCNAEH